MLATRLGNLHIKRSGKGSIAQVSRIRGLSSRSVGHANKRDSTDSRLRPTPLLPLPPLRLQPMLRYASNAFSTSTKTRTCGSLRVILTCSAYRELATHFREVLNTVLTLAVRASERPQDSARPVSRQVTLSRNQRQAKKPGRLHNRFSTCRSPDFLDLKSPQNTLLRPAGNVARAY